MTNLLALREGTELVKDYRIQRVLGAGGFGITYLADEPSLARVVTIKEYFPSDFAARDGASHAVPRSEQCEGDYKWGLDRFIEEGQTLARFTHPNIVRVYRYFEANNTAYIVLHFEEGASFKGWLKGLGRAPRQAELDAILAPLLDALELIHAADFLHRDIAPDNIIIRKDGSPVLIDFGAARGEIAQHSRTVSALVKPGYSPYEQYATSARTQGPWSDMYSLAATLYQAISGKRPTDSPTRVVADDLAPAREVALSAYRPRFLAAIDKALRLEIKERPQSVKAWRAELLAIDPKPARRKAEAGATTSKVAPAAPRAPAADHSPAPLPHPPQPPPARTRPIAPPPAGAVEPLVTAPPRSGGLLREFMAGFRRGDAALASVSTSDAPRAAAAPSAAAASPAVVPPAPIVKQRAATLLPVAPAVIVKPPSIAPPLPAKPSPSPERHAPRAVRAPIFTRRHMRSLGVKLLVGIGVAAVAVAIQERWPQMESRGSGTLSSAHAPGPIAEKAPTKVMSAKATTPDTPAPATVPALVISPPAASPPLPASVVPSPPAPVPAAATAPPLRETALIGQIKAHVGTIPTVAFSGDGQQIVTTGADATIKVWTLISSTLDRTIELDDGPANSLALTSRRAVTAHKSGALVVWDLDRGDKIASLKRNQDAIAGAVFLGDGNHIAATGADGSVALWNLQAHAAPTHILAGHEAPVLALAYSPGRNMLASASADTAIRLWDVAAPTLVRTYRGHQDQVTALAFSSDLRMLASAADDGRIRIWSTQSARSYRTLRGHQGPVRAVSFAPTVNGLLASGGEDGAIRLWDIRRGRTIRVFQASAGAVHSIAFSSEGRQLASAGVDGIVRIWDVSGVALRE